MRHLRKYRTLAAMAAAWVGGAALAQQAPVVPTPSELSEQRRGPATITDPARVPPAPPRRLRPPTGDVKMDIAGFELAPDAPAELREALPRLTAPYIGKGKSMSDLFSAAEDITRHLQANLGYYLGFAYIPEQVSPDGVIKIAVLEGRLEKFDLKWPKDMPVSEDIVRAYLAQLPNGAVIRVRDIERVIFLINDLRGISAEFTVKSGTQPGMAIIEVAPKAERLYSANVDLDNHNAASLGEARLAAGAVRNSPFGEGGSVSLSVVGSEGLAFVLGNYTRPIGSAGFRAGLSLSGLRYKIIKSAAAVLDIHGEASTVSAFGLYPVIRSRNRNLFALVSADAKRYVDDNGVAETRKNVDTFAIGLTGDLRDNDLGDSLNSFDVQIAGGRFTSNPPVSSDPPDRQFSRLTARVVRLQSLVQGSWQLYGALRIQKAFSNLDSTEQSRIGGPEGVRALAPGEGTSDNSAQLTLEARYLVPVDWLGTLGGRAFLSGFVDYAFVQKRNKIPVGFSPQQIADNEADYAGAGFGLTWVGKDGWSARASIAKLLQGQPAAQIDRKAARGYLQVSKQL